MKPCWRLIKGWMLYGEYLSAVPRYESIYGYPSSTISLSTVRNTLDVFLTS